MAGKKSLPPSFLKNIKKQQAKGATAAKTGKKTKPAPFKKK